MQELSAKAGMTAMIGWRTAESVTNGHPDKFCDLSADSILDAQMQAHDPEKVAEMRTALEVTAKNDLVFVTGEIRGVKPDIEAVVNRVSREIGYTDYDHIKVIDFVKDQSANIANIVDSAGSNDGIGAGDQGIMVGYATNETTRFMPLPWQLARDITWNLKEARVSGRLPWLGPDGKAQITLNAYNRVQTVVVATHHDASRSIITPKGRQMSDEAKQELMDVVVMPVICDYVDGQDFRFVINGNGVFEIGGPAADAGTVGRKIVADAYGPCVPVGGGAYSGKDPSKVDRSGAYMARYIAKNIVHNQIADAHSCTVKLAYAIGSHQPEMVCAVTDSGYDLSRWVREFFGDQLTPQGIIDRFNLWHPKGWSYAETAAFGHYGREHFPWEELITIG